ncbi:MAG: TRAP transporter large permease [Bacteroidetes bacterium]|nr:TRAP transporter large permease [Bacteroidota bacterium]
MTLIVLFGVFIGLIVIQVPVAFAMGISSMVALVVMGKPVLMIVATMFAAVDSFPLMAIPFFILAGEVMNNGGITKRIVNFSRSIVGFIKGGLAHVNIVASMFFAGISGSATADASALGSILIPMMEEDGYSKEFSVVVTATSSTIGPIIPPSIMMVMFGVIANVSIGKLFLGGFIPGVSVGIALMIMTYIISVKKGYGANVKFSIRAILVNFKKALIAIVMPVIIIGGVLSGIFTATEAGVVATVYALVISLVVYRTITIKDLPRIFINSAILTSVCLFVIASASIFGRILAIEQFPIMIRSLLLSFDFSPTVVELLIIVFILFLGLFVEGIPVLIIFAPIFVPVIMDLGLDLVHFGVVFIMAILIGSVTPPVGILLYICCNIAGIPVSKASKIIWPFVGMMMLVLFLCLFIPSLVTFIPSLSK